MGPTWVLSAPGGPHVGPMNIAIRVGILCQKALRLNGHGPISKPSALQPMLTISVTMHIYCIIPLLYNCNIENKQHEPISTAYRRIVTVLITCYEKASVSHTIYTMEMGPCLVCFVLRNRAYFHSIYIYIYIYIYLYIMNAAVLNCWGRRCYQQQVLSPGRGMNNNV